MALGYSDSTFRRIYRNNYPIVISRLNARDPFSIPQAAALSLREYLGKFCAELDTEVPPDDPQPDIGFRLRR